MSRDIIIKKDIIRQCEPLSCVSWKLVLLYLCEAKLGLWKVRKVMTFSLSKEKHDTKCLFTCSETGFLKSIFNSPRKLVIFSMEVW